MMSLIYKGEVLDFKFKKLNEGHYSFCCGHLSMGELFRLKLGWTAVQTTPNSIGRVDGFRTRWQACLYLLKAQGFHNNLKPK